MKMLLQECLLECLLVITSQCVLIVIVNPHNTKKWRMFLSAIASPSLVKSSLSVCPRAAVQYPYCVRFCPGVGLLVIGQLELATTNLHTAFPLNTYQYYSL